MLDYEIKGLEQAQQNMRRLSKEMGTKGARFAARKAANVIKEAAQQNAQGIDNPETAESIAKNIVARFSPSYFKQTGGIKFRIGVLGGAKNYTNNAKNRRKGLVGRKYITAGDKKNPGGDTWYWRFIEFGTSKVAAKPFLRPALEQNAEKATGVFASELNRWLDRAVKKLDKAAG